MAIDLGKSFKVATIPIAAAVGVHILNLIINMVIGAIPVLGLIVCVIGPLFGLIGLAILAWAGYKSVKEAQMDLTGGAVTGAVTGVVGGVINAVISFAFLALGLGASLATSGGSNMLGAGIGAAIGIVAFIISLVLAVIFGVIIGGICGAIGAYIAGMKK